ncbi:hypothetical protein ACWGN5_41270 [Streptomyces sp. NPDC055815]
MFNNRRTRIAALVTGAVTVCAATAATVAFASTPGPARAPYSQAAGLIEYNGTISQNKGIAGVTKPADGINCIKFTEPRIDPQKVVPNATIAAMGSASGAPGATPNGSTLMIRTDPFESCGNDPDTITVITVNGDKEYANLPFYFTIG